MAHNLEIINGQASAMFSDMPAWHGLGTVVVGAQTWEDTMRLARLDWEVEKRQLYGQGTIDNGQAFYFPIPVWGMFRQDNGEFLGEVGKVYKEIQNKDAFAFVDAVLGVENGAHYESAGVLGKGERIWCLARTPDHDFSVAGKDQHKAYLLFTTSHDGSTAATCKLVTIRVVCQNTLNASLAMNGTFTKVKHTTEASKKLEAAKKLSSNAVKTTKEIEERLNTLSRRILDKDTYVGILDRLFPASTKEKDNKDGDISTRRANLMREVSTLFENNDGNKGFSEFRGTAYNLLNAITEYTDHKRGVRITEDRKDLSQDQARHEAALFGSGAAFKEEAEQIIWEMTGGCATRPYVSTFGRAVAKGEIDRGTTKPLAPESLLDSVIDVTIN